MPFFTEDNTEFKSDFHALLDEYERKGDASLFRERAMALAESHTISLKKREFVNHLWKLVAANNYHRARKLVDVLPDRGLSDRGVLVIVLGYRGLQLSALAAFIWLIVWLAK